MNRTALLSLLPIALFMGCITGGMVVNNGNEISIEYQTTVLNHTFDKGAISFIVGDHSVLPGLEAGVIGMRLDEEKTLTLPPSLAYGMRDESIVIPIKKEVFKNMTPDPYSKVTIGSKEGIVVNITDELVIIDLNHPFADQEIIFNIKILTIKT